ncbi:polyprenyl synthetase family protein [Myxococcota bacterium]|nr:polyprenyl synthetase family protein [Myxococcota bacterium]
MMDTPAPRGLSSAGPALEPTLDPLASAATRAGAEALGARLSELRDWLADDLDALEVALLGLHAERGAALDLAERSAAWLLNRPGKRIRPLCVLLAARLGGRGLDRTVRDLALAVELVHAATLLHDDVIDEGTDRRGAPASRVLYGNSASILGGDHLLTLALRRVAQTAPHGVLIALLDVIAEMVRAEALQLERRGRFEPSRTAYLEVIHGKTAALFRWGLWAGGTVAELPAPALAALAEAGVALGMAFQLVDDAIDLESDGAASGKTPFADLREGKLTWPLVVAVERDAGLADEIRGRISEGGSGIDETLVARVRRTGGVEATRAYAAEQAEIAAGHIARLPDGEARRALQTVVLTALRRSK